MNPTDLQVFTDFETLKFPSEACTIQNAREKEIKDSAEVYLCVVADKRWPNQCRLEHLRPYTAINPEDGGLLFGWTRIDWDGCVDHITNSIHLDNERVVAWKKVEAPVSFMPPKEEWSDGE